MSTLHERLLAELDAAEDAMPQPGYLIDALRAVVELHAPVETWCSARTNEEGEWEERAVEVDGQAVALDGVRYACFADKTPIDWPCSTITAIAEALGVDGG